MEQVPTLRVFGSLTERDCVVADEHENEAEHGRFRYERECAVCGTNLQHKSGWTVFRGPQSDLHYCDAHVHLVYCDVESVDEDYDAEIAREDAVMRGETVPYEECVICGKLFNYRDGVVMTDGFHCTDHIASTAR